MKPNTLIQVINKINHNKAFQFFIILVIVFSALLIGAKTYDIDPKYITLLGYVDQAITYLFLFEITVRFVSEGHSLAFFKKGSFVGVDRVWPP